MQTFLHYGTKYESGYFHVWISSTEQATFFTSDIDKAFFLTLMQDTLSPRLKLKEHYPYHYHYSNDIDLLAFSLTNVGVHLLVHAACAAAIDEFGQTLLFAYGDYLQDQEHHASLPFDGAFVFDKLLGRHEALQMSKKIHLLHEDWRGDRYSSIGFYVDDRRGDWMRPYRITSLFEGNGRHYVRFLKSQETEGDTLFEKISAQTASLQAGSSGNA